MWTEKEGGRKCLVSGRERTCIPGGIPCGCGGISCACGGACGGICGGGSIGIGAGGNAIGSGALRHCSISCFEFSLTRIGCSLGVAKE